MKFIIEHFEILIAIIANIIGWTKTLTKILDWNFNKKKYYYTSAFKTCGYSTQYMCGTYFKIKERLHQIRDHIDQKLPAEGLVESFSSCYLKYSSNMNIDYEYFENCANILYKNIKLSKKLKKLNDLLRCNFSNNGILNETCEIRNLAIECLNIINQIISKYQLPENTNHSL